MLKPLASVTAKTDARRARSASSTCSFRVVPSHTQPYQRPRGKHLPFRHPMAGVVC